MRGQTDGMALYNAVYQKSLEILHDMILHEGQYRYVVGEDMYSRNLMNLKLIIQEAISYKDDYNDRRDYYMAQNILHLLNLEPPGAKAVVWAHNGHIARGPGYMGGFLAQTLKETYYAIGFEFYAGSFQTRNVDSTNKTPNWDIMTLENSAQKTLPWYMNKIGKNKFFVDFRYTGVKQVKLYLNEFEMHSIGSMYSVKWPSTYPSYLSSFDGFFFIKNSTAARNFTKVYSPR